MTPPLLNGAFERVGRTNEHLADLRQRLAELFRRQEDSIVFQFDPNPPHELKVTAVDYPRPSMRIGVLIGEISYNLRSAMDYLVFALAQHDSGSPQEFTQFPIVDKPK
jgi:hypothetical protein